MDKVRLAAIKTLQGKAAADILAAIPDLERDALSELIALEADCNSPREEVTKALAARIEQMDAGDEAAQAGATPSAAAAPAPTAAKAPDKKHYQHPDYAGPLTIDQAAWRNANIKPVPAKAVKTK